MIVCGFFWTCFHAIQRTFSVPSPLFKGAHQAFVRTRAQGHRFAVLRPASEDALLLLLDNGRTAVLPAANCEAPTDNQTYRVQVHHTDLKVALRCHLQQQGCRREDLPPSALEGGACEAGGPGPHGGFLLLGLTTSVSGNFRNITDIISTKNLRIVNKRFKNRIKHLKIVKIFIDSVFLQVFRKNFAYYCSLDWHGYRSGCRYSEMLIYHFEWFRHPLFREIKSHFSRDNQPRSSTTIENTVTIPVFGIFDMLN